MSQLIELVAPYFYSYAITGIILMMLNERMVTVIGLWCFIVFPIQLWILW